jgi:hypothetical protein
MRSILQIAAAVGLSLCVTTSALAQPVLASRLSPVEVGFGIDGTWLRGGMYLDTSMVREAMATLRLTLPFTPNLAFEGVVAAGKGASSDELDYQTKALYAMQIKHGIWRGAGGGLHVFATYGAAGVWRRVVRHDEFQPPVYAVAGAGFQWELAARAALRVEVQGVAALAYAPVGARVSMGVSLPIGRDWNP